MQDLNAEQLQLRGVTGSAFRLPPMMTGTVFSLLHLLWVLCLLVMYVTPFIIMDVMKQGQAGRYLAVAWCIVSLFVLATLSGKQLLIIRIRYLSNRFRIVALRRFHDKEMSFSYRTAIAPAIGCYGIVTTVRDETLASGVITSNPIVNVPAFGDLRIAISTRDHNWHMEVWALIATSDLVVIDLSVPTVHLLWETAMCLQLLPVHRIIVVCVTGAPMHQIMDLVVEFLEEFVPSHAAAAKLLRPIEYWGSWVGAWRFRARLFQRLRKIATQDRLVRLTNSWSPPPPKHS